MRRRYSAALALITAAAALGTALASTLPGCRPKQEPNRPNVLLITLDTTRADRIGCYGYAGAETPALDALAAGGLRFEQAFTHVPLTLPSHACILTGLLPPEHGLRDNGRGKLGATTTTIAEIFRKHGYRTAAFVASFVLDKRFGLARGFEVYDDRMSPPAAGDNVFEQENRAGVVADRALAWLEQNAGGPFFCWVHFFDPHEPYDPPEPYRTRLADRYDGEIAYMDAQVKRLLDFLDRRGLRKNTLVIAVGDHGESFGEHKEFGHGMFVYAATMHVPLILRLPGRIPTGTSRRITGLADIAPTILALLGWRKPTGMNGEDMLEDSRADRACYGESEYTFHSHGWAPLFSLTTRRWKYIAAPTPELFDRTRDPGEQKNLAGERPEVAGEMRRRLDRLRAGIKRREAERITLSPEDLAKLRQLGYLSGSTVQPSERIDVSKLHDPKTMVSVYNACRRAGKLIRQKQYRRAVGLLRPHVAANPNSEQLHSLLAKCHLSLKEFEKATPHVKTCLGLNPANRPMWANLGTVLLETNRADEAVRVFRRALRLPPDPREPLYASGASKIAVKLHVNLGVALMKQKKLGPAAEQFKLVLKDVPNHAEANNNLANVYAAQGENALAIRHCRRALEAAPDRYEVRRNLGVLLCREKRYAGALETWREGLKFRAKDPLWLYNIAWCLATCPDAKVRNGREAVVVAESLCRATGWNNAQALDALGAAYAEAGQFGRATKMANRALALARTRAEGLKLAREIEHRLELYAASKPYRQ